MFAVGDISRFESEKSTCKILKPVWDVTTDYLVLFLAMLSIAVAGMEVTSGSFQCLAAVDCPGISRSNMSSSLLSHMKYSNACKAFYSSQKANVIRRTDVVTDLKSSFQYINFVNSECSKSAIPNFLAYFWFVLFIEAFVLMVLDNLWLKLPTTASVIENFVSLVMECYASPCPNWALTQVLADLQTTQNGDDQQRDESNPTLAKDRNKSYQFNVLEDPATISSVKALYEKVHALEENVKSSDKFVKIWQLYLIQSIFQVSLAIIFFAVDIYYMKDLQETMTCTLTQHIPVTHDYFICSHALAPTFALGLKWVYLPILGLALVVFIFITSWTFSKKGKGKDKFQYNFKQELSPLVGIDFTADMPTVIEDLGFLLHLLHSFNKLYVIRFAHFLSKKSKKYMQAYCLKKKYPVSYLERRLKENGDELTFYDIQGIPETIFNLSSKIETLYLMECRLENDDFENFSQLIRLRKLSIFKCGLNSIPEGILNIECLEVLMLRDNFIAKVNPSISQLQNLTALDLSENNLVAIEPDSVENLDNLHEIYLPGNSELHMDALRVVLTCKKMRILDPPRHLSDRRRELNQIEQAKFDGAVKFPGKGNVVVPYTPEDAPHIDLEAHEKIYKMNSSLKGIAIIINNYSYQNTAQPDREGSERDVSALKELFEKIGFRPICRIDNNAEQAKEFVEKCAEDTRYKECDSIAVAIMSYGSEDGLYFPDGKVLSVIELVKSVQKSPLYEGKPKLFFVQADRRAQFVSSENSYVSSENSYVSSENSYDHVALVSNQNTAHFIPRDADAVELTTDALPRVMIQPPSLPEGADILLSYYILDGNLVSLHNISLGSCYVQALVEIFYEYACVDDILKLLTVVNYEVVHGLTRCESRQVPAPQSTLTKKLYLLPGYPPQKNTNI